MQAFKLKIWVTVIKLGLNDMMWHGPEIWVLLQTSKTNRMNSLRDLKFRIFLQGCMPIDLEQTPYWHTCRAEWWSQWNKMSTSNCRFAFRKKSKCNSAVCYSPPDRPTLIITSSRRFSSESTITKILTVSSMLRSCRNFFRCSSVFDKILRYSQQGCGYSMHISQRKTCLTDMSLKTQKSKL